MGGHHNALMRRFCGFEYDVAPFLMDDVIPPPTAKDLDQVFAAQVAWDLHV
jgi:hypothetical protein